MCTSFKCILRRNNNYASNASAMQKAVGNATSGTRNISIPLRLICKTLFPTKWVNASQTLRSMNQENETKTTAKQGKQALFMKNFIKAGRCFYGIGIVALGIHQLVIKDFRQDILPPFPAWAHEYIVFSILTGIALIFAGIIISGLFTIKLVNTKSICLYLGFCFLAIIITCHLPYILILSPNKASRLDGWFDAGEALAYCGGAFVMAGSFSKNSFSEDRQNFFELRIEKLVPLGRFFYSTLIILFGCSHFVFTSFVSTMVPKWIGAPVFWTYFAGVALIGSGVAIIFKIWIRPIAFLLAIMLFLFFIFFHVPAAIANPSMGGGNEIVRAIIALLLCGIATVIALTNNPRIKLGKTTKTDWKNDF